jgi:hypothetical protein
MLKHFPKIVPFKEICGKYGRTRRATDDNMAYEHCVLVN